MAAAGDNCIYTVQYQYNMSTGDHGLQSAIPGTVTVLAVSCTREEPVPTSTPAPRGSGTGSPSRKPKLTLPPCPPPAGPPNVVFKVGVPEASTAIANFMACTSACMGTTFRATSTSDSHTLLDPHSRGLAVDGTMLGNPAQIMQCAANCGAVYQQNEYSHPSPNATAGHYHFQLVPGKHGAQGPYYARCTYGGSKS